MSLQYLLLLIPLGIVGCSMTTVKPLSEKQTAEIAGHKFEYVLAGAGQPAIVFVSGYGADMDISWSRIFPQVRSISTVFLLR